MTDPNAEASGFGEASAALGAIRAENQRFQQQISAGQLSMDPSSAEDTATVYEEEAAEVENLMAKAFRLQQVPGLGDYPSGQQLATKFGQKARNGSTGAADLLRQLADEMRRKADLFRQAAKNYRVTDEQVAQDFKRGAE